MKLGRPQPSSFKLKLVAYFVSLSLVPLAATYWGFSTVAGVGESRQVTLRQETGLRAALTLYQEQTGRAQAEAERLARSRPLQRALRHRDRRALLRILAGKHDEGEVEPAVLDAAQKALVLGLLEPD
ncbi:MAG TPA: hypothetical protein VJ814_01220, partial [Gaiellaceae bacterium]|nr:hypothetical protein [Gaiellaceae bacterium]